MTGSASGSSGDDDLDPLVWESFYWGLISALSLNIGSVVGVTCLPSTKVRAILMSFGGGALLFALSIELFGNVLHHSEAANTSAPVWVVMIGAVLGGVFFESLNHALNVFGAGVRKASTTKSQIVKLRAKLMRRLAGRVRRVPFFSALNSEEVWELIQHGFYKDSFAADHVIMSGEVSSYGLFYVLSGRVRVTVHSKEEDDSLTITDDLDGEGFAPPESPSAARASMVQEWVLGPNQLFGDMHILTGSYLRTTATTVDPVKLLVLPAHEVARLFEANAAVRSQVTAQAIERLRQIDELSLLTEQSLQTLAERSSLVSYQKGDVVYRGPMTGDTPILCLVLGAIEVASHREGVEDIRKLQSNNLFCAEHLKGGADGTHCVAKACEQTTVLLISRADVQAVTSLSGSFDLGAGTLCEDRVAAPQHLPGQVEDAATTCSTATSVKVVARESPAPRAISLDHLGWESTDVDNGMEDELSFPLAGAAQTSLVSQVTDLELTEQELDMKAHRRTVSKRSTIIAQSLEAGGPDPGAGPLSPTALPPGSEAEESALAREAAAKHRAFMVWLGILIDAVPESLVIGIIINKSAEPGRDTTRSAAAAALPFVIGVFLSNLPESMGSSGSMKAHGMHVRTILLMWLGTTVLTAIGSALGASIFPPSVSDDPDSAQALAVNAVEGLAAGAMLTMIAQTMMPEAFEQGGDIVGLSCLAGFLCALSVKLVPL